MEEILARLTTIESRLDRLEYCEKQSHEDCERANQRRCDDIDRARQSIHDLESTLHYELSNVRNEISRSSRGW